MVAPVNLDPILNRSAVVLAKMETTYNVDSVPSPLTDAVQVEDPNYTVDLKVLQRNFLRADISPLADRVGRKLAGLSFTVELRGNGKSQSGSLADAPIFGRLLRACGFSETGITGVGTVGAVQSPPSNTKVPTWAYGGTSAQKNKSDYRLTVVLGGASATAKIRVTGGEANDDAVVLPSEEFVTYVYNTAVLPTVTSTYNTTNPLAPTITIAGVFQAGDVVVAVVNGVRYSLKVTSAMTNVAGIATALAALIDAHALLTATPAAGVVTIGYAGSGLGVVVTSGSTALTLGASTNTVTPTWTGNLVLNEYYTVETYPVGIKYAPVSRGFESITLYFYAGGVLHKMTGCFGTFTMEATAGEYGKATFNFTGQYVAPVDAVVPANAVFEDVTPPIIELAKLRTDGFDAVVEKFSFDLANTVVPRPSVNDLDGYRGVRITGRAPTGGIDPEATYLNDYNWWTKMAASTEMPFTMKIGQTAGNIVLFNAPRTQYTGLTYQNREEIRVYDAGLKFARKNGDDEVTIHFC